MLCVLTHIVVKLTLSRSSEYELLMVAYGLSFTSILAISVLDTLDECSEPQSLVEKWRLGIQYLS